MYNKTEIDRLIAYIKARDGIGDKQKLADSVKADFSLIQDRKVYYCDSFAIRFSKSENKRMSNTVLSLSALQKYDNKPFFVCIVASRVNYLLLANSTFLKKISHSSKELRLDNIKGSFNGGDIMMECNGLENDSSNFERLYAFHSGLSFMDNLERLVISTNDIVGRVPKYEINANNRKTIINSISRAKEFVDSKEYRDLRNDLNLRVSKVQGEIAIAAFIDNVNVRGRVIEYLITDNGSSLKTQIMEALNNKKPLPEFKTEDKLGDFSKCYPKYNTETDIKTKVMFLDGNPKAYNVDKLLEFLSFEKSIYMIYLLGVDDKGKIVSRLCSFLDKRLIEGTLIQHHWAGRNTRGVGQFSGVVLKDVLSDKDYTEIDENIAKEYLEELMGK